MGLARATGEACVTVGMRVGRLRKPGMPRRFSRVARTRQSVIRARPVLRVLQALRHVPSLVSVGL